MICGYATDRNLFRFETKLKSTPKIAQYSYLVQRYFSFLLPLVMLASTLTAISIFHVPVQASATPLTCAQGGPCSVGEIGPAGGIVIYVGSSTINQVTGISAGGMYLEAAPTAFRVDSPYATYEWCEGPNNGNATLIGAANPSLGSGASNTAIMVSKCAAGAGNVAANYSKNGYSDWFLPSSAELEYLSAHGSDLDLSRRSSYWSSNEVESTVAATLVTPNGEVGGSNKEEQEALWPIRAFSPGDPLPGPQVAITRASFGSERKIAFITQPQVTIQDASSNTVSSSSAVVTATVSAGGTLVGATTATATRGVATFTNLGLDGTVGTTYTITYTSPGLTPATASVTLTGTTCDGATFTCQVGDTGPGGGKIFYVAPETFSCGQTLSSTCKYLEAAPITGAGAWTDATYAWSGNTNTAVGSTSTAIGTGYSNTLKMVQQSGAGMLGAGSVARNYRGGGKNDWYLPSKDELNEITSNQVLLGATAGYWSSSEATATGAWDQGSNGVQGVADPGKQQTTPVRPIRAFGSSAPEVAIIYESAITGVTPPVSGATPDTTVTAANGYTGTVSWSGSPTTFAAATAYTATITLTPASGFTLTGVTANFFTVAGARSVTHSADSGVITAEFSARFPCGDGTYSVDSSGTLTSAEGCTGDLVIDDFVQRIGDYAFYFLPNSITSLTIPDSVLSIGEWSFVNTTAQVVNIGSGLATIGGNGFGSGSIREFNVSADNSIFSSTSGVLFNKDKTTLVHYPSGNVNASYTVPNSVTEIGSPAFTGGLYLQSVIIPDSVTALGGGFQQNSSLRSITLGSGISEIPVQAFYNNFGQGITEIIFSNSTNLKKISGSAFVGANWRSLVVPEGVEIIEAGAFNENVYLIDLRLPLSMVTLDNAALSGTSQLTKVCYLGTNQNVIDAIVFNGKTVGCVSTPGPPIDLAATAGDGEISITFSAGASNGTEIINYKYSLNGGAYNVLEPADSTSPLTLTGLTNGTLYSIRLIAVNALGDSIASGQVSATPMSLEVITESAIAGVTAPVSGATPIASLTGNSQYTAVITWSGSPSTFAAATTYTATITVTPTSGFTLTGASANFFTVAGAISVTHSADSGVIAAVFPATPPAYIAPTPVLYLKTLTTPKINLKDGKLVCIPGTYNTGYTLDGVIQGSSTALFLPSSYTYNLLISGVVQTSRSVITSNSQATWDVPMTSSGSLLACSVAITTNGLTNIDRSSDNTTGVSAALSTQAASLATAHANHSAQLKANSKAYQKALRDNRSQWLKSVEKNRTSYLAELDRVKALPVTTQSQSQSSLALKKYLAAQKQIASDYTASKPAALAGKNAADATSQDAKNAAIAKANATYRAFIESIGYGVLIP